MIDVVMPQLGESVVEGTVTKWRVREGDLVAREQPLVEVATDKADTVIPSPAAGRVTNLAAAEGAVVPKGGLLCRIDEAATDSARPAAPAPVAQPAAPDANGAPPLASPSTRRLAREAGLDLRDVPTTGERGRVTRDDVRKAATAHDEPANAAPTALQFAAPTALSVPAPSPVAEPSARADGSAPPASATELAAFIQSSGGFVPPIPNVGYGSYKVPAYVARPGDQVVPFSRRRRITADHMVYSKTTAPHVVTVAEVDLHATSKLRDAHKDRLKKEGVPLTFLAFVVAATVKALREHPQVNARVLGDSFVLLKDVSLGIAVDTPGGLVVPSIKHADQLSLRGLATQIDELATRARAGKTTADDLAGTTFTVSNPGTKGNLFGAAIISQPTVGILRMGEIKKRVVVVSQGGEDAMAIHPVMYLALSYDHRIIDGALANAFLWRVADVLTRAELEI